jgi:hypothetical protein
MLRNIPGAVSFSSMEAALTSRRHVGHCQRYRKEDIYVEKMQLSIIGRLPSIIPTLPPLLRLPVIVTSVFAMRRNTSQPNAFTLHRRFSLPAHASDAPLRKPNRGQS